MSLMNPKIKSIKFCEVKRSWSGSVEFTRKLGENKDQRLIVDLVNFSHDRSLSRAAAEELLIETARKSSV